MSIRPKTKRRVFYLALGCAIALCLAAGVIRYRSYVFNRNLKQFRQEGMDAFNAGDYPTAVDKLNQYVTKRKDDPEALLAFGVSRSKVPTLDGSHISHAITIIRRYCELDPGNIEAQHLLVELETPYSAYAAAALDNAKDLLRANPNDLTALKAMTQIHMRERRFPEALDAALKYTDANPTDLEMQQRVLYLMQQLSRPAEDLHSRADSLEKKYPDDPRFLIVEATAYYFAKGTTDTTDQRTKDVETAGKYVLQAADKDPPDAQFVTITVAALDQVGQFSKSQDLLNRALTKFHDPQLMRLLVQRLWQDHKFDEVVSKLADLDPTSSKTDVDLIAYKTMSLYGLQKKADADAILAALDAHDNDQSAVAWTIAIRQRFVDTDASPKDHLEHYQEALQHDPNNPVIQYLLGDTYWHMGENDLALQQWRSASDRARSWAEPHVRVAEVLAQQGRGGPDAIGAAERALITSSKGQGTYDYQAVIAQLLVRFAHVQTTQDPKEIQDLLDDIQNVQNQRPGEPETLPIFVELLLQNGQRDKAVEIIKGADKRADQSGEDLLLKLAQLSRESKLGMENDIYIAIERQYGVTPRLAFARAVQMLEAGRATDGLHSIIDAKNNDKNPAIPQQWDQIICEFREVSHDPGAVEAWGALGDAYPKDLVVQSAILYDEQSAWSNRPIIDRAIKRLQDLTGDQAVGWKIARARWLLDGDEPQRDAADAVVLLSDVLKSSSSEVGPHELMAMAYEKLQNSTGAVSEWRQAYDLAPHSPRIVFGYLRILDMTDQNDEARVIFDKFSQLSNIPSDLALEASILIASEGDARRARTLLDAYPTATDQELHDATLAKVDRLLGQLNDAATIYFKLGQAPVLKVDSIREASDFFASQHDLPASRKFLARLDSMNLPAGQRELILADFEERYGDVNAAAQLYTNAVKAAADDSSAAVQQIGFLLRQRKWDQAKTAIDAATARWPNDDSLNSLKSVQASLSASPALVVQLGSVVDAVTRDPQNSAAVETLTAVAASANQDSAQKLKALSDLISKYPHFLPLYDLATQQMIALHQLNDAVTLATSAAVLFPESADAARICAQSYAAVGRWTDVITAAARWRQRSADHPLKADLLISLADLFINQPGDAIDRLSAYIPDAKADPDNNVELLTTYSEALIRNGNESDAIALLHPLAEKSAQWRSVWLKIAAFSHTDSATAIAWIDQVKTLLDPKSLDDQATLADAYFDVAEHRNFPKAFEYSRDALKPFVDTSTASVSALLTYALACGNLNDSAGAEGAYRQIIKLDPNQPVALNNLADLLRLRGDHDSLAEAESFSRRAIAAQPTDPNTANFYDTLARVLMKQGRTDEAITAFDQGDQLDPGNFSVLIGMADACARAHRIDDAIRYLARIDGLLTTSQPLSPDLQAELDAARSAAAKANNPVSASTSTNQ